MTSTIVNNKQITLKHSLLPRSERGGSIGVVRSSQSGTYYRDTTRSLWGTLVWGGHLEQRKIFDDALRDRYVTLEGYKLNIQPTVPRRAFNWARDKYFKPLALA